MLRAWLNDKPKGRRAPVKVNGHHLNLLIAVSCQHQIQSEASKDERSTRMSREFDGIRERLKVENVHVPSCLSQLVQVEET